jgi:hypothetical protein
MAEENKNEEPKVLKKGEVAVDGAMLQKVLDKQAEIEIELEQQKAKNAGLEAMFAEKDPGTTGEKKLREKKSFEPSFRTVTMKKFPVAGDPEKEAIVIGWTNRGAYQKVDKSGVSAQIIDYIDVIYLGQERNAEGKLQAEAVPLLALMGAAEVTCKVLETKDHEGRPVKLRYSPLIDTDLSLDRPAEKKVETGETIHVASWDPKHGLVDSGEVIDGWVAFTNLTFVLQIPGWPEPVEIDSKFCNI